MLVRCWDRIAFIAGTRLADSSPYCSIKTMLCWMVNEAVTIWTPLHFSEIQNNSKRIPGLVWSKQRTSTWTSWTCLVKANQQRKVLILGNPKRRGRTSNHRFRFPGYAQDLTTTLCWLVMILSKTSITCCSATAALQISKLHQTCYKADPKACVGTWTL